MTIETEYSSEPLKIDLTELDAANLWHLSDLIYGTGNLWHENFSDNEFIEHIIKCLHMGQFDRPGFEAELKERNERKNGK